MKVENIEREINNIISYIEDEQIVTFEKPLLLKTDNRVWYIHSISPDLDHYKLNVFYSDDLIKVNKVDFYDFHQSSYNQLINLIEEAI